MVWRNGRASGLDVGMIVDKPDVVSIPAGEFCIAEPGQYCRNYYSIKVDIDSDIGDSGAGFFRVLQGPHYDAFGIVSFGQPGYTYYYAWSQPFYADANVTDLRTILPCTTADCPL
jgi:hypothetical protein